MKNNIKNQYFYIFIAIVLMTLFMTPFLSTNAFFKDVETQAAGIKITTGTLDIQLANSSHHTVGDQSYYLNLDQVTKSQTIGNLSVKDIGTLSSNLSARVSVKGDPNTVKGITVTLVDSNGNKITDLSKEYIMVNSIHNTGISFGVKVSYIGSLAINSSGLSVTVELKAIQPNDNISTSQMFTDIQVIQFGILPEIQFAFGDGIPIDGTIIIEHNEKISVNLLPKGLDIYTVDITFDDKRFNADYDRVNQKITVYVTGVGNNDIVVMKITITFNNGQTYVIKRDIKSIK